MTAEQIHLKLAHAVTAYDRRQSTKRHYNRYALAQYLARVDEVCDDIRNGADARKAITAGFSGPLATACLKAIGEAAITREEGMGGMFYRPASENA